MTRDGLMCAQDAGRSQTAQIPLFRQVRHERFHLVCLTNTALQAGEEVNLATTHSTRELFSLW